MSDAEERDRPRALLLLTACVSTGLLFLASVYMGLYATDRTCRGRSDATGAVTDALGDAFCGTWDSSGSIAVLAIYSPAWLPLLGILASSGGTRPKPLWSLTLLGWIVLLVVAALAFGLQAAKPT